MARDAAILPTDRDGTNKPIRVDANAGWTLERALRMLPVLKEHGVELLEQPLAPEDLEGTARVTAAAGDLPVVVDESCLVASDIPRLAGKVGGINIKLAKCGSLREALRMIAVARAHGMVVMVGCMIESSLGITAAAHFTPLVDYADLDGAALTVDDPFAGATIDGGQIRLPVEPGLGVERRERTEGVWPSRGFSRAPRPPVPDQLILRPAWSGTPRSSSRSRWSAPIPTGFPTISRRGPPPAPGSWCRCSGAGSWRWSRQWTCRLRPSRRARSSTRRTPSRPSPPRCSSWGAGSRGTTARRSASPCGRSSLVPCGVCCGQPARRRQASAWWSWRSRSGRYSSASRRFGGRRGAPRPTRRSRRWAGRGRRATPSTHRRTPPPFRLGSRRRGIPSADAGPRRAV